MELVSREKNQGGEVDNVEQNEAVKPIVGQPAENEVQGKQANDQGS